MSPTTSAPWCDYCGAENAAQGRFATGEPVAVCSAERCQLAHESLLDGERRELQAGGLLPPDPREVAGAMPGAEAADLAIEAEIQACTVW